MKCLRSFPERWATAADLPTLMVSITPAREPPVTKPSFADLKQKFDLACMSLRAFTLGQRGSSQRGGLAAVERVKGLCDLLKQLFPSGPQAKAAAALVVTGRFRISAAETRLALLRGRRGLA